MARKPIELERAGMQTPRERLWSAARKLRRFTLMQLQDATKPVVRFDTCETYLRCLVKAGYLAAGPVQRRKVGFGEAEYELVKDCLDAPRLDRDGKAVTQGLATLAMWRAMQILKSFDWQDVQRAATLPAGRGAAVQVTAQTAKSYVNVLGRAGYFKTMQEAKPGTPARYRLVRNTGPHAPAVTRRKVVFDRNAGEFAWQESEQEVVDATE